DHAYEPGVGPELRGVGKDREERDRLEQDAGTPRSLSPGDHDDDDEAEQGVHDRADQAEGAAPRQGPQIRAPAAPGPAVAPWCPWRRPRDGAAPDPGQVGRGAHRFSRLRPRRAWLLATPWPSRPS